MKDGLTGASRLKGTGEEVALASGKSLPVSAKADGPGELGGVVPLAIVQHGHQYLITDGYDTREGISEILEGFAAVFAIHLKHRVPLNLHLSGTLIEAIAWHSPAFFEWVKVMRREGLLELIGSAYSQNIMPLFSYEHDIRQLNETLQLYRCHLAVEPKEVKGCWVPERVWDVDKLTPVLRSPKLLNGGYDYVLLDDRLTYPLNGRSKSSERHLFDLQTLPALAQSGEVSTQDQRPAFDGDHHFRPYRIERGEGLIGIPISSELRYCLPPRSSEHWTGIERTLRLTDAAGPGAIAVYGDDLEKTATLGPWAPGRWTREGLAPYEKALDWIGTQQHVGPVLISRWLADNPPQFSRPADRGTFFELAHSWRAGEDYMGWWQGRQWAPYRRQLIEAESLLLRAAAPGSRPGLWELAWKQLMACSYETAWHTIEQDGSCRPAPWAKAVASHVRSVFVIAAAAEWQEQRDGRAHVQRLDIDRDGKDEVILKNDSIFAVFTPHYGGRLVYLFDLSHEGGRLSVGNPADDWNWQQEMNRFMEVPRNHPGAFADVAHENDRYTVRALWSDANAAEFALVNRQKGSPIVGAVKTFRLDARSLHLEASYRLPNAPEPFSIEFCLSPDYLLLLREGKRVIRPVARLSTRGWRNWLTAVWVHLPRSEPVLWDAPKSPECGHGMVLQVAAYKPSFSILLGVGAPPASHEDSRSEQVERLSPPDERAVAELAK